MDVCERIRSILSNAKCKNHKNESAIELSSLLIDENGIIHLLNAVFDFDETSQKSSTHCQRLLAIATIVGKIPKLAFSEETYFSRLAPQLLQLLKVDEKSKPSNGNKLWKAAAFICVSLNERNMSLTKSYILDPVMDTLKKNKSSISLSIMDCVIVLNRLIVSKFPIEQLLEAFPNLFYVRANLQKTHLYLKSTLDEILVEMLSSNIRTVYFLDNTLFHNEYLFDLYSMSDFNVSMDSITCPLTQCDKQDSGTFNLEKVDDIAQTCYHLLQKMSDNFNVDFFLLLIDRMSLSSESYSQLLLYSLMDTLQVTVFSLLLKNTSKAIQFVVSNLERIVNQINCEKFDFQAPCSEQQNEALKEARLTSLNMTLMIIDQLLNYHNEITESDKNLLNHCSMNVEKIVELCETVDEIVCVAKKLKQKLTDFNENICMKSTSKCDFEAAVADLSDSALHIRTHGLITLRRLIICKNDEIMKQKQRLLVTVHALLSDEESYVYLAAIRTLAAFALNSTDDVLPLLMESFRDKQRTVQERVNVGEVLVSLIKGLGEMAHRYSKTFINEFLRGLKDDEPTIRISSLSNLGQICSVLRFGVSLYIVEIFNAVNCLLETDPILDVKRASVMFIHIMLNGIDKDSIRAIESEVCGMYRLVKRVYNSSLDDILQLHCQLAIEQFDRLGKELITLNTELVKRIELID